jgi:hypothetical protein
MKQILYVFIFFLIAGCDQADKVRLKGELDGGKGKRFTLKNLKSKAPG